MFYCTCFCCCCCCCSVPDNSTQNHVHLCHLVFCRLPFSPFPCETELTYACCLGVSLFKTLWQSPVVNEISACIRKVFSKLLLCCLATDLLRKSLQHHSSDVCNILSLTIITFLYDISTNMVKVFAYDV